MTNLNDLQMPSAGTGRNAQKLKKVEIFHPAENETERNAHAWFTTTKELQSDLRVEVGDIHFYLHKFPLLSRSGLLNKLVFESRDIEKDHIQLADFPGGSDAFHLAANFCYGLVADITPANVAALRCAAGYLDMTEDVREENLVARSEAFLSSVVLGSWKHSIDVLRSCSKLLPWAEDLGIVQRSIESIAWKACTDMGSSSCPRPRLAQKSANKNLQDWWIEDVCRLHPEYFVRTLIAIKEKGMRPDLVGAAISCYAVKRLPNLLKGSLHEAASSKGFNFDGEEGETKAEISQGFELQIGDLEEEDELLATPTRQRVLVESLLGAIPLQKKVVSINFLLQLLRAANRLGIGAETSRCRELERKVSSELEDLEAEVEEMRKEIMALKSYSADLQQQLKESINSTMKTKKTMSMRKKGIFIFIFCWSEKLHTMKRRLSSRRKRGRRSRSRSSPSCFIWC